MTSASTCFDASCTPTVAHELAPGRVRRPEEARTFRGVAIAAGLGVLLWVPILAAAHALWRGIGS